MNDPIFLIIDLIIIALVWRVERLLTKIERNTRKSHFADQYSDYLKGPNP